MPQSIPLIRIPDSRLDDIINFYHLALFHAGASQLYNSITEYYTHLKIYNYILKIAITCKANQKAKLVGQCYGHLPPREAIIAPWYEIAVELTGIWTLHDEHGNDHSFTALTIMNMVTNYCEIVHLRNKTAQYVELQLENQWLARYLRPARCVFDQGKEFLGNNF
jgi:hypothetical protein